MSNDFRKDSVLESKKSVSSDLESSRKKFQRGIIEDRETVDLWEAALRMLVYARAILLQKRKDLSASADQSDSSAKPPHINSSTVLASSNKPELTSSSRNLFSTGIRLSATDCTNLLQKHGSSVHRSLIEERDARARPKITSANIVLYSRDDRNTKNVGGLSDGLWQRIIACAAGTEDSKPRTTKESHSLGEGQGGSGNRRRVVWQRTKCSDLECARKDGLPHL